MRPFRTLATMLSFGVAVLPALGQSTVTLALRAKVGQTMRYKGEGALTLEAAGQKLTMEITQTEKVNVTAVSSEGNITVETRTESYEMSVNGTKVPDESRDEVTTITVRPNRTLVAYKRDTAEPDPSNLSVRLYAATTPVLPDKPVGVGNKWSHTYKEDTDLGTRAAHADFELLALEKVQGVDTAKIRMIYKESAGSPALGASLTAWIEVSTGDTVKSETEVENVPFGDGPASALANGKMQDQRIEGNPLGESVPASTGADTPKPKKEKTIDETVKDFEKLPGIFTIYRKQESGRDTIYLELNKDQLGRLFMMEVTAVTGTPDRLAAGSPINDLVFKFERKDGRIFLVTPNYKFRADEGTPVARAVRRSFADAYLEAFKIEAEQPDRNGILINVSDLFRSDIAEISSAFSGGSGIAGLTSGGGASYSMDRDKTYVETVQVFPENLVVRSAYHFTRSGSARSAAAVLAEAQSPLADPRSIPLKVSYTLFELKDTGYKPRLADPRVGYFHTEYQDFSRDSADDNKVRFIYRWHLEKSDPKAAVSTPKNPIVFWLDNAIPLEYRDAVRHGILDWNKAFLKAGFKDAIVVKQMPDDADWDHADMRYNTIRWVTSPEDGYAVALFRINPLTGQILNANITVDANIVRYTKLEKRRIVNPAAYFDDSVHGHDPRACSYASMAMSEAWFGHLAVSMARGESPALNELEFARAFLRSIVTHEMGHIVGLRHNFIASAAFSADQLQKRAFVEREGVTASVMDYTPFNIMALKRSGAPFWSGTVGRYDIWAVQYGYEPSGAATPQGELAALKKIASKCNDTGLAYQSDEIADGFDPAVTRFDLTSDPLAYWTQNLRVMRYLLLNLDKRAPKQGESYWTFTQQMQMLVGLYARAAAVSSRYIGGLTARRNFRGDPGEKPVLEPVPAARQRDALRLINTYIFAPNAFRLPTSYYGKLTTEPFPDLLASILSESSADYPIRDTFASIQGAALRRLLSPAVMKRILNNEFKTAQSADSFTLSGLFDTLRGQIWLELGQPGPIDSLRRQLQRTHLDLLGQMVVQPAAGTPEDARMLAWQSLRALKQRLLSAKQKGARDSYTRIHIDESLMRVNRALTAQQTVGQPAAPSTNLLQMLLGGNRPL